VGNEVRAQGQKQKEKTSQLFDWFSVLLICYEWGN
jgi:hypothetical protein